MSNNLKYSKSVVLPCDCKCCNLVVEKFATSDGEIGYNISVQDSRYHAFDGILARVKNALRILCGKPVYYNDAYIDNEQKFLEFLNELVLLSDAKE